MGRAKVISIGCDIGSRTAKAVVMDGEKLLGHAITGSTARPMDTAKKVMDEAILNSGISGNRELICAGTGYGKAHVPHVDKTFSEIACHGRGAFFQNNEIRTLVDIGGQDAKAVKLDENGHVKRYVYNDKCASGTGRFLEIMAEALDIELSRLGTAGASARGSLKISSQCVVFAETEIISLVNAGEDIGEIVNAMHRAVAGRAASLVKSIGLDPGISMSGGVALNPGVLSALSNALNTRLVPISTPQLCGAMGAALLIQDEN